MRVSRDPALSGAPLPQQLVQVRRLEVTARLVVVHGRLRDLDERAVRAPGAQEGLLPTRARDVDVNELVPLRLDLGDRRLDVVGLEGHVVQTLPSPVEEAREEAVALGLEELDLPPAGPAELDPAPGVGRVAAHQVLAAEGIAEEPHGGSDLV